MQPLTSNQQHCLATPRRGNLVHKLTANFRDPMQLEHAYWRMASIQHMAKYQAEILALPPLNLFEPATPANTPEL